MADINVTVAQATPINVTTGGNNITVQGGQVLPVFQQKETYVPQKFTATVGQTVFQLSGTPRAGSLEVFRNGVAFGADEFSVTGSTLTLNGGVDAGDIIDTRFVVA